MATITGYTAARMKAIEDAVIVDGDVVGDNLILTRYDGGTINAGSVRGATGSTGPTGEVTTAAMNAALTSLESDLQADIVASMPVGSMTMYAGTTAPTNWLLAQGQSISRTTYATLFTLIGTTYGSVDGSSFNIPDFRGRFPVGVGTEAWHNALNKKGGSKDAVVVSHSHTMNHDHPSTTTSSDTHSHSANHNHTASSAGGGDHAHLFNTRDNMNAGGSVGDPMISNSTGTASLRGTTQSGTHTHGVTVNTATVSTGTDAHTHTLDVPNYTGSTSTTGSSATEANLPPFIAINFMIKVL